MIDRLSAALNLITLKLNVYCTQLALTFLKKINNDQESSTIYIFMKNNFTLKQNFSVINDIMTNVTVIKINLSI